MYEQLAVKTSAGGLLIYTNYFFLTDYQDTPRAELATCSLQRISPVAFC